MIPETPRANRPCRVTVNLRNPLRVDLTGCVFSVESPGLTASVRRRFRRIAPEESVDVELELRPWRPGPTTVVATFNSEELYNVTGTRKITVLG